MWIVIIWIICGILSAVIASGRGGNAFLFFVFGILFGPFGVIGAFFAGPSLICPFCKEAVKKGAVTCPHCQKDIEPIIGSRAITWEAFFWLFGIIAIFVLIMAVLKI